MREIDIQNEFAERIDEFRQVYAEITSEDPDEVNTEYIAHAVLGVGLDLMMVHFFGTLNNEKLQESIDGFYKKYPNCFSVEPSLLTDNKLVGIHVALSNRYPKQFFAFMFEKLKALQWADAKKRGEELFRRTDLERNGSSE